MARPKAIDISKTQSRKRRARAPRKPRRNPLDCPGYRAWILGNIERDIAARAAAARRINADGATLH